MEQDKKTNTDPFTVMKFIWIALVASVFTHGLAAYMTVTKATREVAAEVTPFFEAPLFFPITLLAMVFIFLAHFLPKKLIDGGANRSNSNSPDHHSQSGLDARRLFLPFLIRMLLFEAVAICGFALSALSGVLEPYLIFAGVTLLGFVTTIPSAPNLQKLFPLGHRA